MSLRPDLSVDRRAFLGAGAALCIAPAMVQAAARCAEAQSLGAAAANAGLVFGCSIGVDVLPDAGYIDLIRKEARILTTDLAFKLPFINPERGKFDFSQADLILHFANNNGLPLRAHTLFWDWSNPDWVKQLSVTERAYEFDRILDIIIPRYAGKLHSWDLVNELFWPGFGEPGGFRRGAWYDALGKAYVSRAFERAARLDPSAILVLNQDMTEREDDLGRAVRKSLLTVVDDLLAQGRNLGAVGLQGHVDPSLPFDPNAFEDFLWQLAERKLPIYITELDVLDTTLVRDIQQRDEAVASLYSEFLTTVLKVPAVEVIGTWQLADHKSWYRSDWYRSVTPSLPAGWVGRPLPFNEHLARKPAWHAMKAAFCAAGPRNDAKSRPAKRHKSR